MAWSGRERGAVKRIIAASIKAGDSQRETFEKVRERGYRGRESDVMRPVYNAVKDDLIAMGLRKEGKPEPVIRQALDERKNRSRSQLRGQIRPANLPERAQWFADARYTFEGYVTVTTEWKGKPYARMTPAERLALSNEDRIAATGRVRVSLKSDTPLTEKEWRRRVREGAQAAVQKYRAKIKRTYLTDGYRNRPMTEKEKERRRRAKR